MGLGNILEMLSESLAKSKDGMPTRWDVLVLKLVQDAYKAGYVAGVLDASRASIEAVNHSRNNLCILEKIQRGRGHNFEDIGAFTGAWSACDTIEKHLRLNLGELTEEELH